MRRTWKGGALVTTAALLARFGVLWAPAICPREWPDWAGLGGGVPSRTGTGQREAGAGRDALLSRWAVGAPGWPASRRRGGRTPDSMRLIMDFLTRTVLH
jgi:hypothetical protein